MNERIRELKEQAFNFVAKQNMTKKEYFWENIRHDRTLQDMVDQKFAELIVQQCAYLCLTRHLTWRWYNEGDSDPDNVPIDCARLIRKHFGVDSQ